MLWGATCWPAAPGVGPLAQAEHVLHAVEARLAVLEPQGGAHRALGIDPPALGAVGELDALRLAEEHDGMVADRRPAAQRREADRAGGPRAGVAVAAAHRDVRQ